MMKDIIEKLTSEQLTILLSCVIGCGTLMAIIFFVTIFGESRTCPVKECDCAI